MISIVIPVLNEAAIIADLLEHLTLHADPKNISEIIIVDGGSTDDTEKIVRTFCKTQLKSQIFSPSIKIKFSAKGRAKQMNYGAKVALGSVLYFLHADSFPPEHFDKHILKEISRGHYAGCFRMTFRSHHWWLKLAGWFTQFNWRACRGGDQSLFVTKTLFNSLEGYDETFTIFEDQILIKQLYKLHQFVVINKPVSTSARLYDNVGVWRLQYHFWTIYVMRWFGASASSISDYYKKHISL